MRSSSTRRAPISSTFPGFTRRQRLHRSSGMDSPTASRRPAPKRSSASRTGKRSWPGDSGGRRARAGPQGMHVRISSRRRANASLLRILAVADEVDEFLYGDKLETLRPDVIVSCGDLPFDYLEFLVTSLAVPLLYVPGNHDPNVKPIDTTFVALDHRVAIPGPEGCDNVDGRVLEVQGLRFAGLGGSLRYKDGPNQYTQAQMRWRPLSPQFPTRLNLYPPR